MLPSCPSKSMSIGLRAVPLPLECVDPGFERLMSLLGRSFPSIEGASLSRVCSRPGPVSPWEGAPSVCFGEDGSIGPRGSVAKYGSDAKLGCESLLVRAFLDLELF